MMGVMRTDGAMALLRRVQGPVANGLGLLLSMAALAVVVAEVREQGMAPLLALLGAGPAFWIAFSACLLVEPLTDYAVMRRQPGVGPEVLAPLVRKQALNNLVFGYAGDTYFAAWLRRHTGDTRRAFAMVCDLAIGSALANNAATLLLLAIVWGPVQKLAGARLDGWTLAAAGALIAVPAVLAVWRRARAPEGGMGLILAFQCARTAAATVLVALVWHFALPEVTLGAWLLLMAARMVVSRLPVVPNKDLAFAGLVSLFMGGDDRIAPMVAAVALLTLVAHGLLMLALTVRPRGPLRAPVVTEA